MSDTPPPPSSQPPPPPPGNLAPPPGYVAYGTAPTPMTKVGRIKGLSTAISVVVAIAGLGSIATALLQPGVTNSASDFLDGTITETEFQDSFAAFTAVSFAAFVGLVAGAILVMIWMYRMSNNMRAFGQSTTWHPLFAVFGWFLPPFALYIIPFLMLRELWTKSAAPAGGQPQAASGGSENPVLWAWLVLFGLLPAVYFALQAGSLFSGISATDMQSAAENIRDSSSLGVVSSITSALAAAVWVVFVRQQTKRHMNLTGEN